MARPRRPLGRCPARSGRLQFASACAAPGAAQRTDGEADRIGDGVGAVRGEEGGGAGVGAQLPSLRRNPGATGRPLNSPPARKLCWKR